MMGTRGMLATDFSRPSALLCCTFAQKTYRLKGFTATSRHFCHRQKRPYRFIPTALHELTDRVPRPLRCTLQLTSSHAGMSERHVPTPARPLSVPSVFLPTPPTSRKKNKFCFFIFFFFSLSLSPRKRFTTIRRYPSELAHLSHKCFAVENTRSVHPRTMKSHIRETTGPLRSQEPRRQRRTGKKQSGERFTSALSCQNKECKAVFWRASLFCFFFLLFFLCEYNQIFHRCLLLSRL